MYHVSLTIDPSTDLAAGHAWDSTSHNWEFSISSTIKRFQLDPLLNVQQAFLLNRLYHYNHVCWMPQSDPETETSSKCVL